MRDPETPAEWQEAVDSAYAWIAFESARIYGLVEGGPDVDIERCAEILAAGAERGYRPADDAIERLLQTAA